MSYIDNYRNDDSPPEIVKVNGKKCYSVRDTAKVLGKVFSTFSNTIGKGLIPHAEIKEGRKKFYTKKQVKAIKAFYDVYDRYHGRAFIRNQSIVDKAVEELKTHFKGE